MSTDAKQRFLLANACHTRVACSIGLELGQQEVQVPCAFKGSAFIPRVLSEVAVKVARAASGSIQPTPPIGPELKGLCTAWLGLWPSLSPLCSAGWGLAAGMGKGEGLGEGDKAGPWRCGDLLRRLSGRSTTTCPTTKTAPHMTCPTTVFGTCEISSCSSAATPYSKPGKMHDAVSCPQAKQMIPGIREQANWNQQALLIPFCGCRCFDDTNWHPLGRQQPASKDTYAC